MTIVAIISVFFAGITFGYIFGRTRAEVDAYGCGQRDGWMAARCDPPKDREFVSGAYDVEPGRN
jgi:hypothetical protein